MTAAATVTPIQAALIGACGAIIGGLLTVTANLLLDSRKASRERATERRGTEREVRRASRLVADDLVDAAQALGAAINAEHYPPDNRLLRGSAWAEGRAVLAAELPDAAWAHTCAAHEHLRRIERLVAERARRRPAGAPIPVLPEDDLLDARAAIDLGLRTLRGLVPP
ncbi:hypothetical protein [Solirubrobacter soli]|uniref:hypothetical protein n=1 Tax=Solirubrobacter soli TaxID=363832 RepID=UPI0012FAAFF9|nr:hypothetical protein [Solirubrobacter soli]